LIDKKESMNILKEKLNINLDFIKQIEKDECIYNITKSLSIEYTKLLLSEYNQNNWINYLDNFTKKDDLCDSFLQGYYTL
jgi:transcriptional regulator of met regulon